MSTRQQQNGEEIQFLEQIQNQNGKLLSSMQLLYNSCVCMCFCDWIVTYTCLLFLVILKSLLVVMFWHIVLKFTLKLGQISCPSLYI